MELIKFINEHPSWESLLAEAPYNVKVNHDSGYMIFKYMQVVSDFMNPVVRECRGIILRELDYKPVCVPFFKFGNYGESYCPDIDWASASVQQKIDGSLMKAWNDNGEWHISTNGTIDAFKAELQSSIKYKTYGDLFLAALPVSFEEFASALDKNKTYMFELISPYNRVVIPYENTELYFLGVRDNNTLLETMPEHDDLANKHWFKIPIRYNLHSLADVQSAANALPWDEEGYVVCDKYFNRVKIKSPDYIKAHYTRSNNNISYEHLLEVILAGEKDEFLIYAADYKEELEHVESIYNAIIKEIKDKISELKPEPFEDRKTYAMKVMDQPKWTQMFLFKWDRLNETIANTRISKWLEIMIQRGDINE